MPYGQNIIWPKAQQDLDKAGKCQLLPRPYDVSEFLQFIYPLRARAVTVLTLIHMAYAVADTVVMLSTNDGKLSATYIAKRILTFSLSAILFISAHWASPTVLSRLIHGWFVLLGANRCWTIIGHIVNDSTTLDIMVSAAGIMPTAIGCTMHIDFRLYLIVSLVEWALLMAGLDTATEIESQNDRPKLWGYISIMYVVGIWVVHTVQYNTLMTFLWNKRYRHEKAEKDAQQRMEDFHRKHLANTLHDVGTPLQAFVNGIDELRAKCAQYLQGPLLADITEVLSSMEAATGLMTLARRRAMAYARSLTEDEELQPRPSVVNIQQLVGDCTKMIVALSKSHHPNNTLSIECRIADDVPAYICTDGDWVAEALSNYMSNGVKFTQEGYVRLSVSLRRASRTSEDTPKPSTPAMIELHTMSEPEEKYCVFFEVADTGIGVSDVTMASLFRPVTGLPPPTVGTGLGLLSVRRKVELLGGTVGVMHNEPKGSIFWFEIPLGEAPIPDVQVQPVGSGDQQPQQLQQPPVVGQLGGEPSGEQRISARQLLIEHQLDPAKIRLLLVDDEKMLLKFSTKMFTGLGFKVDQAQDGQEALDKMKAVPYTAVLMDQNMPHLDGLGAVRRFREWQSGDGDRTPCDDSKSSEETRMAAADEDCKQPAAAPPEEPCLPGEVRTDPLIFMMSASILPSDRDQARDLCITDYFEKPLQISDVAAQIISHLIFKSGQVAEFRREELR